jgi:hypothetical protein
MKRIFLAIAIALSLFTFGSPQSCGALTTTGPFVGTMSESWESFPQFTGVYLPSPTTIMGGHASIASPQMAIYGPNQSSIGTSGIVQLADGVRGLMLNYFNQTATITWSTPVTEFGSYFAAATLPPPYPDPTPVTLQFFSPGGSLIEATSFTYSHSATQDGGLDWHGWVSSQPIGSVSLTGDFLVMDGLQAITVPEPNACWLAGGIIAAVAYRRRGKG